VDLKGHNFYLFQGTIATFTWQMNTFIHSFNTVLRLTNNKTF